MLWYRNLIYFLLEKYTVLGQTGSGQKLYNLHTVPEKWTTGIWISDEA